MERSWSELVSQPFQYGPSRSVRIPWFNPMGLEYVDCHHAAFLGHILRMFQIRKSLCPRSLCKPNLMFGSWAGAYPRAWITFEVIKICIFKTLTFLAIAIGKKMSIRFHSKFSFWTLSLNRIFQNVAFLISKNLNHQANPIIILWIKFTHFWLGP
jgi:hypothetical protein